MSKFCTNCGNEIQEGGDICLKCGKMLNGQNKNNKEENKINVVSLVSFILGIIGFITSFIFIGIIFGIIGFILAIVGLVTSKKNNSGKGFAIAGLIISIISIIISSIYIFIVGVLIADNSLDIKNEINREMCRSYGSEYSLTNGKNVTGSYEYDEWFCCPSGKTKSIRNCEEI